MNGPHWKSVLLLIIWCLIGSFPHWGKWGSWIWFGVLILFAILFCRRKSGIQPLFFAEPFPDGLFELEQLHYDGIPLKYRDYKEIYTEEQNDRIKEIEKGERRSLGNINAKIISDQVYELSEKQAYSIFDYMKTLSEEERAKIGFNYKNINTAIMKIREGRFVKEDLGLWEKIKLRRQELFQEGYKKADVAAIVSNEFFYPEEEEEE